MRLMRSGLPLVLLLSLPMGAQAQAVSAEKLSQALGTPGLKATLAPKFRPEQVHQDYDIVDSAGKDMATVTTAPPAYFAEWQKLPGFEPLPGVGQQAFVRPRIDQVCGRSARAAACVTLMPMAFPKDKKPTLPQLQAALATLL
ncbi:hypothetical protein ACG02S_01910 [Roseateles sp. DC23W]|uniref:Uncharacterized protein n=1 Tax=Pelomonas dachongensis TaxID=3299029 RepID=A0ABW7EH70_9BURK